MSAPFVHRLRVRFNECDPQGIVFNANWFMYFDVAINELWREAIGSYVDFVAAGHDMVVAEASARFLAPARFDDEVELALRIARLGTTAMTTEITATVDGTVCVEGTLRHVIVRTDGSGKAPIPPDARAAFERYAA